MSRTLARARADLERARRDLHAWRAHEQEARRENELAVNVPDDPAHLGDLARELADERAVCSTRSELAARGVHAAGERARTAMRALLVEESKAEDAAARAAEREASRIRARVGTLAAQIEALEGVRYSAPDAPSLTDGVYRGETITAPRSKSELLLESALTHRFRAAVLRYAAEHGRAPQWVRELDWMPGHADGYGAVVFQQVEPRWVPDLVAEATAYLDTAQAAAL